MTKRKLGSQGLEVSPIGLGCMGMSEFYGHADEAESDAAATEIEQTPDEVAQIDEVAPKGVASGLRYPEEMMKMVGL